MISLLRGAVHHGVAGDHARTMISLGAASEVGAVDPTEHRATSLAESLSDRELQVLRLLGSELTGPQIARGVVRLAQHGAYAHQAHLHQA
jgi:LuxR family maltose regulon positive regulatory protein